MNFSFYNKNLHAQTSLYYSKYVYVYVFLKIFLEHNGYGQKPLPQSPRNSGERYPPPPPNDPLRYPGDNEPPSLQSISSDFSSHNSQKASTADIPAPLAVLGIPIQRIRIIFNHPSSLITHPFSIITHPFSIITHPFSIISHHLKI